MNVSLPSVILGVLTIYFGLMVARIIPTLFRLLTALSSGMVKWPGPRIHDTDHSASVVRERLGVGYQHLFSTFIWNTIGGTAAFIYFLFTFVSTTSLLSGYIVIKSSWILYVTTFIVFIGGRLAFEKAQLNQSQITTILSDLAQKVEPRTVDSQSARAQYAIEHPILGLRGLTSESKRAFDLYYESVRCHQDGNKTRAFMLYQEAMKTDPSLHENAIRILSKRVVDCGPDEEGAIYYWLGIHSEYSLNWKQAAIWYEKAALAFDRIGYKKRESRVRCNLGNVKMQMRDPSGMEELEKAIALDPKNGTAHLNIARIYYSISDAGDYRYELALDAFADAIIADPLAYGPEVISSLQEIGYTWKEDLEEITKRVERKQLLTDSNGFGNKGEPTDKIKQPMETQSVAMKTYRSEKSGFEIDLPKNWLPFPIPPQGGKELIQYGSPDEAFNFEIGPLFPAPPLAVTEIAFRGFARNRGFSEPKFARMMVAGKEHVCAHYQINDNMGNRWNKKYMLVFGRTEYAITATCNDPQWFAKREKDWDAIVQTFRLLAPLDDAANGTGKAE